MIAKTDLEHNKFYIGECRNAKLARWDADKQKFIYLRYKCGFEFMEEICHPNDEKIYDVFIPETVLNPLSVIEDL